MPDIIGELQVNTISLSDSQKDLSEEFQAEIVFENQSPNKGKIRLSLNKLAQNTGVTQCEIDFLFPDVALENAIVGRSFDIWSTHRIAHGVVKKLIDLAFNAKKITTNINPIEHIPHDKTDIERVQRLANIGFPKLNPIIPDLLNWIQDMSWPVANYCISLLKKAGPEILPFVLNVFESEDYEWIQWVIIGLWESFSLEVKLSLLPRLRELMHDELPPEYREVLSPYIEHFIISNN